MTWRVRSWVSTCPSTNILLFCTVWMVGVRSARRHLCCLPAKPLRFLLLKLPKVKLKLLFQETVLLPSDCSGRKTSSNGNFREAVMEVFRAQPPTLPTRVRSSCFLRSDTFPFPCKIVERVLLFLHDKRETSAEYRESP